MNPMPLPIDFAKQLISTVVKEGDFAIDATVGNGHDTLFLCGCVGDDGVVLGYDIQEAAIESTRNRLEDHKVASASYKLVLGSHAELEQVDLPPLNVAMFNLGYLPGSDKSLITNAEESLKAIRASMSCLVERGVITIMCYPGHEGGDDEAALISDFCAALSRKEWQVICVNELENTPRRPFLIALSKRANPQNLANNRK